MVLGVAIVENALDPDDGGGGPAGGADRGRSRAARAGPGPPARLPVDDLDVLLVDRMGKDISGVGLDTNVIGRLLIAGEPEPERPRISHDRLPRAHPGLARQRLRDGAGRRGSRLFAAAVDHEVTRTNIVTSGFLLRGKLPLVADDDRHVWELCLRGACVPDVADRVG